MRGGADGGRQDCVRLGDVDGAGRHRVSGSSAVASCWLQNASVRCYVASTVDLVFKLLSSSAHRTSSRAPRASCACASPC